MLYFCSPCKANESSRMVVLTALCLVVAHPGAVLKRDESSLAEKQNNQRSQSQMTDA